MDFTLDLFAFENCVQCSILFYHDIMCDKRFSWSECPVSRCERRYYGVRSRDCLRDHLREFSFKCEMHSENYNKFFPHARRAGAMRFTCDICSRQIARPSILNRHAESHFSKRYPCPKCHKRFQQRRNVVEHLEKQRCRAQEEDSRSERQALPHTCNNVSFAKVDQTPCVARNYTSEVQGTAVASQFPEPPVVSQTFQVFTVLSQ